MNRATGRLINAVAFRLRLLNGLPGLEQRLLCLLDEGEELATRKWKVKRKGGRLVIHENRGGGNYVPLRLPFLRGRT